MASQKNRYICSAVHGITIEKMKKIFLFMIAILLVNPLLSQEIEMKNGKYYQGKKAFTGTITEYFDNGKIQSEKNIKDGLAEGITMTYYENGVKKEQQSYKKGLKDGIWFSWDEAGNKTGEASYKKNLKHGPWYIWDENGTLRYEMFYIKGEKTGTWLMWDEAGKEVMRKDY
jgi:antitoxin component YwqK of YwqJK toxin-antitoxin module